MNWNRNKKNQKASVGAIASLGTTSNGMLITDRIGTGKTNSTLWVLNEYKDDNVYILRTKGRSNNYASEYAKDAETETVTFPKFESHKDS